MPPECPAFPVDRTGKLIHPLTQTLLYRFSDGCAVKLSPFKWLAVDGRKAQFTHSAACHITGLSADTFKNWETRGIVSTERPGHGVHRKYCGHDLIVFGLAGKLVQLGLGAKDSAGVALHIWRGLLKHNPRRRTRNRLSMWPRCFEHRRKGVQVSNP